MDIQSRASPCRIRAERRSHRPAQRGSRNRWSTRRGGMDGRMQEAYDGRKVLSGGADGHTIQCCLPIVTSPTPHNVLQYIVQCQLWCHHTIMIIQKKNQFYILNNRFSTKKNDFNIPTGNLADGHRLRIYNETESYVHIQYH